MYKVTPLMQNFLFNFYCFLLYFILILIHIFYCTFVPIVYLFTYHIYTCLILIHFDLRMTSSNFLQMFFNQKFLTLNFLVKCSSKSSERKAVRKKGSKMKSPIWQPSSSFGCQNIFLNSYGNQNDRSLEGCKNVMKTMTKHGYLGCMEVSPAGVPRVGL